MKIDMISAPNNFNWTVGTNKTNKQQNFTDALKEAVEKVKDLQQTDYNNSNLLATGQEDNLHKIMIDSEKAEIALQMMVQVHNKALEAYQEIMRIQL